MARKRPPSTVEAPDQGATSDEPQGEQEEAPGKGALFGGLGEHEASRRGVEARRAKRRDQEGTLRDKVGRAIDNLSQRDVDVMVRTLTSSATGAQALLRLLDYVETEETEEEGGTLSAEQRRAIYESLMEGRGSAGTPPVGE